VDGYIDAHVQAVPAAFGVDWTNRGATRTSVEVGKPEDVDEPIDGAVGSIVVRAASTDGALPPTSPRAGWVEITPEQLRADYRFVGTVREPEAPIRTDSSWVVEAGRPGARPG